MKIGFLSLGCPKNLVDGEVMLGIAREAGHELTADAADADVLVVNTCAFIDSAKQESIDAILEMAAAEARRQLLAAGRHRLPGRALPRRAEEGDPGDRRGARHGRSAGDPRCDRRSAIRRSGSERRRPLRARSDAADFRSSKQPDPGPDRRTAGAAPERCPTYLYDADTPRLLTTPRHFAYVKVAEGCDYTCAFCIIPTLRGKYRSRDGRLDRPRGARRWRRAACASCC